VTDRPGGQAAQYGLWGAVSSYLDRHTGGLSGDVGRAASATQAFLAFSAALTAAYTVFFATHDLAALRPAVASGVIVVLLLLSGLGFVGRGHQLTAAIIALTAGTAQVAFVTTYVGWAAGFQLYLLAGGQLVFMLFTEKQRGLRWAYVALSVVTFFYCQLVVPDRGNGYTFTDSAYGVLFSINASLTLLLMTSLAASSYYTALQARKVAALAAERAQFLANTDELTGLANRRPVLKRLEQLSENVPYVVAIADLDHFKQLNDAYGHECGDRVLAAIGQRLLTGVRAGDSVGRWGGEEFIFVMAEASVADATATMERLSAELAAPIPCVGHSHEVTMSVGLTDAQPDRMVHRALQRADAALYEAKEAGRNTVRFSAGPDPAPGVEPATRRRRS
jgi:diguanylate cyclase (GGDEF)-like protein